MVDMQFILISLLLWFALGYPIAWTLRSNVLLWALLATPIGIALDAILTVILYVFGLDLASASYLVIFIAVPGFLWALRDAVFHHWSRSDVAFMTALFSVALLIILPKWLAPPDFSIFAR